MQPRLIALLVALFLAACAQPQPVARRDSSPLDLLLAPYEDDAFLPPEIAVLPLAPGRAYVILVHLPGPAVVDLSDPARAQAGLRVFLNPLAVWQAGTSLGHVMVGWRCADGARGLTSHSGDSDNLGRRLLVQGWGIGAMLANYSDGHLVALADLPESQRRALRTGRARIVVEEVPVEGCQRLRHSLADHIEGPAAQRLRYGMVSSPGAPLGTGCGGFAVWLAGQGGALHGLATPVMRPVILRDSFVGTGSGLLPAGVTLPPMVPAPPLPLLRLLGNDWAQGQALGEVVVFDMELLLHALDRAAGSSPRLDPADPAVRAVTIAADRWIARYARLTPVRIGSARAVILHRR